MMEVLPHHHISSATLDLYKTQHFINSQMLRMFPLELDVPSTNQTHQKIESGVFVEMTELLPEWLGLLCTDDDASRSQRSGPF